MERPSAYILILNKRRCICRICYVLNPGSKQIISKYLSALKIFLIVKPLVWEHFWQFVYAQKKGFYNKTKSS